MHATEVASSGGSGLCRNGDTTVPPGGVVERVVVFDGRVRVEGRVRHDVVVLHGSATVTGRVGGDVDVLSGRATVASTGRVGGSVRSGDPPRVARGAVVHDGVHQLRAPWTIDVFSVLGRFLVWLVVSVSTLVLGGVLVLFAPRGLDAVRVAGARGPGPAVGWCPATVFGLGATAVAIWRANRGAPREDWSRVEAASTGGGGS